MRRVDSYGPVCPNVYISLTVLVLNLGLLSLPAATLWLTLCFTASLRSYLPHPPLCEEQQKDDIPAHSQMREEALELRSQLKATLLQQTDQVWLDECLIYIQRGRDRT